MPKVNSKTELRALVAEARKAPLVAYDVETTGFDWMKRDTMFAASFCFDGKTGWYVRGDELLPLLGPLLGDSNVAKVGHNIKFDLHFTRKQGFHVGGTCYDTETMSRLWNENQVNHKLKDICRRLWGAEAGAEQDELKAWMQKNGVESYAGVPDEIMTPYAVKDVELTYRLFEYLKKELLAKDEAIHPTETRMSLWSLVEREAKVCRIVEQMEARGHLIDLGFLERYKLELAAQQELARAEVLKIAGVEFNPASDEQVADQMLKLGWLPKERTKGGSPKTDKYALEDWEHPFSEAMMEFRRCGKLVSTYCEGMAARAVPAEKYGNGVVFDLGVIHPDYRTNGASTGRFSCTNPNMQNTDKKSDSRKAFVVRPGYINVYLDFKQIEICGFAYYADDKIMQDALWEGEDYHMMNAEVIFGKPRAEITKEERDKAKTFNFMLLYGAGEARIAKMMKVSKEEAGQFKKRYFAKFNTVNRLSWKCQQAIRDRGFIVNRFGRRRNLRGDEAYKAMNALIQSWAADLLKESLVRMDSAIRDNEDVNILLQIHDEVICEIKDDANFGPTLQKLVNAMESVGELVPTVPIRVDVKATKTTWHTRKELPHEDLLAVYQRGVYDGAEVPAVRELAPTA